ncbi:hypothetical protein E2C01_041950 [Portunus trituberculatus]|uniref:Uncharacterized protein n=1 Tax=Portunus trituberculatus TaxID=210409 RepID=A0A5B7FNV7_PORTR|nr:hypothetical protein [Portunus trituberculatus]
MFESLPITIGPGASGGIWQLFSLTSSSLETYVPTQQVIFSHLGATSRNPCELEGGNGTPSDVMSVLHGNDIEDSDENEDTDFFLLRLKKVKTPVMILIVIWETETNPHSDVHKPHVLPMRDCACRPSHVTPIANKSCQIPIITEIYNTAILRLVNRIGSVKAVRRADIC